MQKEKKELLVGAIFAGILVMFVVSKCSSDDVKIKETPQAQAEVPTVSDTPSVKQVTYGPGLGLSYSKVTADFDAYIPEMKDSPLATGEMRRSGQSNLEKAAVILEVIGDLPNNVDRASLSVFATNDEDLINLGNIGCIGLFMRNTIPEWDGGFKWAGEAIGKLTKSKKEVPVQEIVVGDKRVTVKLFRQMGMFSFTTRHKSALE